MSTDQEKQFLRILGDGLVLRRAAKSDADALADFNAEIHGQPEKNLRSEPVGIWARDLLERPEMVGTLPEYRNRGLVRAQFE